MKEYSYYLENKENIKEIKLSSLTFNDELSAEDYTNVFDIFDNTRDKFTKITWVIAIFLLLLSFSVMLMINIDTTVMFITLFCFAAVLIIVTCVALLSWAIERMVVKKQKGVLIDKKGDKVSIYCKEQGIVKLNIYTDYWHSSKVKIGDTMLIYKIRNRYYCIKGYSDESD